MVHRASKAVVFLEVGPDRNLVIGDDCIQGNLLEGVRKGPIGLCKHPLEALYLAAKHLIKRCKHPLIANLDEQDLDIYSMKCLAENVSSLHNSSR